MSKFLIGISALIGTIIGAGILGIPYVVMRSGFLIGFITLLVVGIIICLTTLYLGEITLRTNGTHQLSGYADRYLGKKGKFLMLFIVAFGIYAAIVAYIIGEGSSLSYLFYSNNSYSFQFEIVFWIFMSIISFYGIKALEEGDLLGVSAMLILIASIIIFIAPQIKTENLISINISNFFYPFGVIIFAYLAFSIVPEIKRILSKEKQKIKPAIIISYFVSFLIYSIFTAIVLGFKGADTPEISTTLLGKPFIILGMLTMFTSYLSLSIAIIDNLRFDFRISKVKAWLITSFIPIFCVMILEFTKNAGFTRILSISGIASGGVTAILILIIAKIAKTKGERKPEYSIPYSNILAFFIALILILGAFFEIRNIFG